MEERAEILQQLDGSSYQVQMHCQSALVVLGHGTGAPACFSAGLYDSTFACLMHRLLRLPAPVLVCKLVC